jgi:hypothetical protein
MKISKSLLIYNKSCAIVLFFITLSSTHLYSQQQPAFPTAYGAGAYVSGGRGQTVYHVTTTDFNDNVGSFKWAFEQAVANNGGTIVFDVSGVITLQPTVSSGYDRWLVSSGIENDVKVPNNISILGQTAPFPGITIDNSVTIWELVNVHNLIIRYVKFRGNGVRGHFSFRYCDEIIFDHCSLAYSKSGVTSANLNSVSDFNIDGTAWTPTDITYQYNLMAHGGRASNTGNSSSDPNADYGDVSIMRNVYHELSYRTPIKSGGDGQRDIFNNIVSKIRNGKRQMRFDPQSVKINHFKNLYTVTQNNVLEFPPNGNSLHKIYTSRSDIYPALATDISPEIYEFDNDYEAQIKPANYDNDPTTAWKPFQTSQMPNQPDIPASWFTATQHPLKGRAIPILETSQLKDSILPEVGACRYINDSGVVVYYRDDIDTRYVEDVLNNTDRDLENTTGFATYGNFTSNTRPVDFYQSNPHIPEAYLESRGITGNATIHNELQPSGYTLLEEYYNQVDYTSAIVAEGVTILPEVAELTIPDTLELEVQFIPDNTTNKSGVWTTSDETIATVDANGVVTPIAPGVVTITFTSNDGGFTDTSEITVFPEALQASAGDDQTICEGESTTLVATSNNGSTYLWSTGETTAEIEVSPIETSTYTVAVSNDLGEEVTDDVVVTVNPVPVANAGNDQTICQGESITLTASGGTTYLWSTGETTATITVSPDSETTYTVEAISNDCSSTDAVLISVMPSPELVVTEDVFIYIGDSTTLTVDGAQTYEWSTGETTNSILVSPTETTIYTVTGFANGCETTAEVLVTVLPPINANAGEDETICSGESVILTATGGIAYVWDSGENGPSIEVSPTQTTTYTVTVTDALGATDTDDVIVNVNETPVISVSDDVVIFEGESTTLAANGASSYLWSTGDTTDTIIVTPAQTTTYTVIGSNDNCEATTEVVVTVIPEVVANAGADVAICSGESVNLTATGGTNYSWDSGEQVASITVSPAQTTTYTVTVSDDYGNSDTDSVTVTVNEIPVISISDSVSIIEGDSTVLLAEGADSYLWSTGETTQSITVSPTQTTTYTVIGISNSCEAQAQVIVTVEELFQATAGDNQRVCQDDNYEVQLTAGPGDSYLWNTGETTQTIYVNPVSTSTYTVTVTQGSQQDTASVTVFVDPNPNVVIANGDSVDILNGDFITLSASGANNYQWSNGATQPNIAVSPSETTTYEVRGYVNDCYDEKEVTVNVYQPVEADAGEDVLICLDESTILTASGGDEYLWNTGEITQSIEVSPQITTEYTVTVFNAMDYDEDSVTVNINNSCADENIEQPEESLDFSVMVYPNPATNIVNIRMTGVLEITEMLMYDFTGKLILRREINNEDNYATVIEKVDVRDLRHGVYFLKLIDNDKEVVKKIIVN